MSDDGQNRSRFVAYAGDVLQLNPELDAEQIIAARTAVLELVDPTRTAEPDIAAIRQNRQTAIDNLRELREKFWTLSPEELDARLEQLAAADAPDLQSAIGRLQTVARYRRQAFYELAGNSAEESFANILKDVFVTTPRDAAALKEAIRQAFRRPFWRRAPRRFVVRLRDELPELYELEADWFERLLRQWPSPIPQRQRSSFGTHIPTPPTKTRSIRWWHIVLLLFLLRLLGSLLTNR